MIYCVVPEELAEQIPGLYDRLVAYYKDDPDVEVIIDRRGRRDRRKQAERRAGERDETDPRRMVRDRRRPAGPRDFPV